MSEKKQKKKTGQEEQTKSNNFGCCNPEDMSRMMQNCCGSSKDQFDWFEMMRKVCNSNSEQDKEKSK